MRLKLKRLSIIAMRAALRSDGFSLAPPAPPAMPLLLEPGVLLACAAGSTGVSERAGSCS